MKCKYCGVEIGNSLECHLCGHKQIGKTTCPVCSKTNFILIKNIVLIVEVLQFIVSLSQ
mgnify:CR=1 FL=1